MAKIINGNIIKKNTKQNGMQAEGKIGMKNPDSTVSLCYLYSNIAINYMDDLQSINLTYFMLNKENNIIILESPIVRTAQVRTFHIAWAPAPLWLTAAILYGVPFGSVEKKHCF